MPYHPATEQVSTAFPMPYKLVAFDVDGTLVDNEGVRGSKYWTLLHSELLGERAIQLNEYRHHLYKSGVISYSHWCELDLQDFKDAGVTRDDFMRVAKMQRLILGARETVAALHNAGVTLAVISGSIDTLLETLFPDHPFSDLLMNKVYFDNNLISSFDAVQYDGIGKVDALRSLSKKHGVSMTDIAFIGDGHNDIEVLRAAGLGIAFCPDDKRTAQAADVVVCSEDLRVILPYLRK